MRLTLERLIAPLIAVLTDNPFPPDFGLGKTSSQVRFVSRLCREFLAANNQITDSLDNHAFNVGNDLMKSLQPPLNQTEQEMSKQWTFTQDFYNRLGQINRSEQFLDEMTRQAETNSQNQVPFQQTARNSTMVNLSDRLDAEDMKFWENDRRQPSPRNVPPNACQ